MRETPIFLLPVKNLTSPSCSPTRFPIRCVRQSRLLVGFRTHFKSLHFHSFIHSRWRNFGDSAKRKGQIAYFSLRMRERVKFLLTIKYLTSLSCSPTPISYTMQEFWRVGHKYGPNWIFFIAHAQNGLIPTSCQKSEVTIVFPDPDFL